MKNTERKLKELQAELVRRGLKAYYVVTSDPHNSEYVAAHYLAERLAFCTFTGSDGNLLVTVDGAYLFTDGRYFIQAEQELARTSVRLMKLSTPGYPSLSEFVRSRDLYPLGLNKINVSQAEAQSLSADPRKLVDVDFSSLIEERPPLPTAPIFELRPDLFAFSRAEKIGFLREQLKQLGCDAHLLTTLNDIAYLLNLRGGDIPCTPVFMSFLYVDQSEAHLFVDQRKLAGLNLADIVLHDYLDILSFLKSKEESILYDPRQVNCRLAELIKHGVTGPNPSSRMKCIKDPVEIENVKRIHILDGVAMVKFIRYLHDDIGNSPSEYQLAKTLERFRRECPDCFELSFDTIAAAGANAAQMHYDPSPTSSASVSSDASVLLVDSGGQYYGGTTDITRTFILREPEAELKRDYTLTLKSVIDLSSTIFLRGCSGRALDIKARENMWREHMDYKCGTGHGVGYMLGVHEGPNGFRYRDVKERDDGAILLPGMITTVEPGVYKAGRYGIRIENELLTVLDEVVDDDEYYKFEVLTCCPIETKYLDLDLLDDEELAYLNSYHRFVYEQLSPYFSGDMKAFLAGLCREAKR